jgi:hypothetical protein
VHKRTPGQRRKRPTRANFGAIFAGSISAVKTRYFPLFPCKILYFHGFGWKISGNFYFLIIFLRIFSAFSRGLKVAGVAGIF